MGIAFTILAHKPLINKVEPTQNHQLLTQLSHPGYTLLLLPRNPNDTVYRFPANYSWPTPNFDGYSS